MEEEKVGSVQKKLRQELECSICLSQYEDPRFLPCLHTFCAKCLTSLLGAQQQKGGNLSLGLSMHPNIR